METVADAVTEAATGDRPSRLKSFLAASLVGFTAAAMTYRLLRRGAGSETEADEDEGN
jgi:hypothetical protein